MTSPASDNARSGLDLCDRALGLLSQAPAGDHLRFLVGTVPFDLFLLYALHDLTLGAVGPRRLFGIALLATALYVWMKAWQADYARRLWQRAGEAPGRPLTVRSWLTLACEQVRWQVPSLVLLPLSALAALPYGWALAYYHHLALVPDRAAARRLAGLSPREHHAALALTALFACAVFTNALVLLLMAPSLLKSLVGWRTPFADAPFGLLSTTTVGLALVATHLVLGALVRALYALRAVAAAALVSGADLTAELERLSPRRGAIGAVALVAALFLPAAARPVAPAEPALTPPALERAVSEVRTRPEFAWRLAAPERDAARETGFLAGLVAGFSSVTDWLLQRLAQAYAWLRQLARHLGWQRDASGANGGASLPMAWLLAALLLAAVGSAVAISLLRARRRLRSRGTTAAVAVAAAPDLAAADHTAAEASPGSWLALGRSLAAGGEWRLAIRALYLEALAELGRGGSLHLTAAKSNRDYERELARHGAERLAAAFRAAVAAVEPVWYGEHLASAEGFAATLAALEAIQSRGGHAAAG